jgi:hypothetical protein
VGTLVKMMRTSDRSREYYERKIVENRATGAERRIIEEALRIAFINEARA